MAKRTPKKLTAESAYEQIGLIIDRLEPEEYQRLRSYLRIHPIVQDDALAAHESFNRLAEMYFNRGNKARHEERNKRIRAKYAEGKKKGYGYQWVANQLHLSYNTVRDVLAPRKKPGDI